MGKVEYVVAGQVNVPPTQGQLNVDGVAPAKFNVTLPVPVLGAQLPVKVVGLPGKT